ncbi:hypothetical protein D9M71_235370 [compost metagenome]
MDAAHGHFFFFQLPLFHQPAADRAIGVAVLVGVTDAQLAAVFQLNAARTLDLQELQVHRVGQPGQYRCLGALGIDGFCGVIGFEHPAFKAAAQALALELGIDAVQGYNDHVVRYAIDGHIGAVGLGQAARIDRLVVASDQAIGVVLGRTHAVDVQLRLEKTAYFSRA